ncbi:hypothetical protein GWK47_043650 [Chionoecetes opilio]|uniref:Uncharacterized protein n=1 Tax=Chionoecetes opilio TaxID=41210 RepID=A0A8J5CVU5_CHIOP|nr:hypothetical protein GWK47_043650 [Chionoecetes opilio]
MSGRFPGAAPHRPAAHPPTPHREAERLIGVFTARGSSAQIFPSSHTATSSNSFDNTRVEAVREAPGENPDGADPLFHSPETVVGEEKKGRDTACRDGGVPILHARSCRAGRGRRAARHAQRVLAGRSPATSVEGGQYSAHPQAQGAHQARPISLISCTAKTAERMVLSRLQWRVGALHPHVFGFTRGVAQLTASSPC